RTRQDILSLSGDRPGAFEDHSVMHRLRIRIRRAIVLLVSTGCCLALPARLIAAGQFNWQTTSPESQGMSTSRLNALRDDLAVRETAAFLVVRNDRMVYEWYAPEHASNRRQGTASLAKALIAGMSLAVALDDGLISLDDKASKYIPQ